MELIRLKILERVCFEFNEIKEIVDKMEEIGFKCRIDKDGIYLDKKIEEEEKK
ncbi:MAG: hypothetical protein AABY22_28680 [Nanoarchaeota archaeon]